MEKQLEVANNYLDLVAVLMLHTYYLRCHQPASDYAKREKVVVLVQLYEKLLTILNENLHAHYVKSTRVLSQIEFVKVRGGGGDLRLPLNARVQFE